MIQKALQFIVEKHDDQKRKGNGMSYQIHCCSVASILRQEGIQDEEVLVAALLHDTLEDTKTTPEELQKEFSQRVMKLVKELTNDPIEIARVGKRAYMRKKIPSLSEDALLIKLADFLDNFLDSKYTNFKISEFEQRRKDLLEIVQDVRNPFIYMLMLRIEKA